MVLVVSLVAGIVVLQEIDDLPVLAESGDSALASGDLTDSPSASSFHREAWLPYWDSGSGLESLRKNADKISKLHPFWYEARSATDIALKAPQAQHDAVIDIAKQKGFKMVPTITEAMNAAAFGELLNDPVQRDTHIHAVCDLVKTNHFDGIDIDYENFATDIDAAAVDDVSQRFVTFIGDLASCVHSFGGIVSVTTLPRADDVSYASPKTRVSLQAFDYKALGRVADFVEPMAYDYHYPGSPPGSVDPANWMHQVIAYSRRMVPRHKIVMGIALYGEDWSGASAKPVIAANAPELAKANKATIAEDDQTKSSTFGYTKDNVAHIVWFDTPDQIADRVEMAKKNGLAGISYWALGDEEQATWSN